MTPQGSSLINTDYFDNLISSINEVQTCAELQSLVNESAESLSATKSAIVSELAKVNAMLSILLIPDANLAKIITWITSVVNNFLTPMLKPTITYAAQLTALAAQITDLVDAINAASSRIGSCTITIPPI